MGIVRCGKTTYVRWCVKDAVNTTIYISHILPFEPFLKKKAGFLYAAKCLEDVPPHVLKQATTVVFDDQGMVPWTMEKTFETLKATIPHLKHIYVCCQYAENFPRHASTLHLGSWLLLHNKDDLLETCARRGGISKSCLEKKLQELPHYSFVVLNVAQKTAHVMRAIGADVYEQEQESEHLKGTATHWWPRRLWAWWRGSDNKC